MIVYQYDDGKHGAYSTCTKQVKGSLPSSIDYMLLTSTSIAPNCEDYRATSNLLRCKLASEYDDMVWLDSDIILDKWFDFEIKPGKPYFAQGIFGLPENWAFIVNGCTDFFKEALKTSKDCKDIWWLAKFIQANKDSVEYIPKGYLTHLMLSRAIKAGKHFKNYGNNKYNVCMGSDNKIKVELRS